MTGDFKRAPLPLVPSLLLGVTAVLCVVAVAAGACFLAPRPDPIAVPSMEITPFARIGEQLGRIEVTLYESQRSLGKPEGGPAHHVPAMGAQPMGEGSAEQ